MISGAITAVGAFFAKKLTERDVTQPAGEQNPLAPAAPTPTPSPMLGPDTIQLHLSIRTSSSRKESRLLGYGSMLPRCSSANDIINTLRKILSTQDLEERPVQLQFIAKSAELSLKAHGYPRGQLDSRICSDYEYELCKILRDLIEIAKTRVKDKQNHSKFMARLDNLQGNLKISLEKIKGEGLDQEERIFASKTRL